VCYIPRPSHPPLFDHPNNICLSAQVARFLIYLKVTAWFRNIVNCFLML
jgi:hypothetical protein